MKNEYFDSDEFKEILNTYEASGKHGQPCYLDADDFADIADFYLGEGKADDGLVAADNGLLLHPDSGLLMSVKSGILIYKHRYEEARDILDEIADGANGNDVFYQKAQLKYALDKDADTAEEMFREWIELEIKEELNNGGTAEDEFVRDSYIHVITSFVELSDNHDYDCELVKRWVEEYIVSFSPLGNYDPDLLLADIVRDEALTDMVEKVYSLILETNPYANYGWTVLAAAQNSNGKFRESLESCDFALAVNPDDWDAKLTKAHNYYSLGEMDTALSLFKEIMDKFDDTSQSLAYAICLISSNNLKEGAYQLERAAEFIETFRSDEPDFYASACFEIAEAYLVCDEMEKGEAAIDKALEINPHNSDYLLCKGTFQLLTDRFHEAIHNYSDCVKYSVDKVVATINIAIRFIYQNEEDIALELLDTCHNYGADSEAWRVIPGYRAFAYYRLKRFNEFLSELETACKDCPEIVGQLFASVIPETVSPKDYYGYLMNHPF